MADRKELAGMFGTRPQRVVRAYLGLADAPDGQYMLIKAEEVGGGEHDVKPLGVIFGVEEAMELCEMLSELGQAGGAVVDSSNTEVGLQSLRQSSRARKKKEDGK